MTTGQVAEDESRERRRTRINEQDPWPGLGAFDEEAQEFFNGRRGEAAELRRLVLSAPMTVLFAASGLGKTSLLQAGVFPRFRKDNLLPIYVRLDVRDRSAPLIDQVRNAMFGQFQARHVEAPAFTSGESLWEWLHRESLELWSDRNRLLTPLFVFDQFEEVFTLGSENVEAVTRFRIGLADLVENRIPTSLTGRLRAGEALDSELSLSSQRYKGLLSFREDFLPTVEGWKADLPSIMRNRLRLLPMTAEQAFEAVHITAPHLADEAITREIVRFVAAAQDEGTSTVPSPIHRQGLAVEPALLSLICHGLNERRKAEGKPTFDLALLNGTGQAIISDYYRHAVADLPERVQRFIEEELITERGYRKPCDIDDARGVHSVTDEDLRLLVDRRLLRIEPHHGTERVELTHDLLTRVVREHRDRQRERQKSRRQRRRIAMFGLVSVVLAGLVVVFGFLWQKAEHQRRTARIETVKRRVSQAQTEFQVSPVRGLLLAVEALKTSMREQLTCTQESPCAQFAADVLVNLLSRTGGTPLIGHENPVVALSFSADGKLLATADERGPVNVWRVEDLQRPFAAPTVATQIDSSRNSMHTTTVSLSADGKFLATGGFSLVRLFRIDEPAGTPHSFRIGEMENIGAPTSVSFSPDGKLLLMASGAMTASLWRLDRLDNPIAEWKTRPSPRGIKVASFTSDGKFILMLDNGGKVWQSRVDQISSKDKPKLMSDLKGSFDSVLFSPDGKNLVTARRLNIEGLQTTARLINLNDPETWEEKPVAAPTVHDRRRAAALSGDGMLIATSDDTGVVRVWRVDNLQKPLYELRGHEGSVYAASFSPNGVFIATAGDDRTARLWRVGQPFAIAKGDASVQPWRTRLDELIEIAGKTAGRNFTREEWSRFFPGEQFHPAFPDPAFATR